MKAIWPQKSLYSSSTHLSRSESTLLQQLFAKRQPKLAITSAAPAVTWQAEAKVRYKIQHIGQALATTIAAIAMAINATQIGV